MLVRHGLYPMTAALALHAGVDLYGSCRWGGEGDGGQRTLLLGANAVPGAPVVAGSLILQPTRRS